jgi:Mg-chelatase subunit ChlD
MIAHSSSSRLQHWRRSLASDERGAIVVFIAVSLLVILGSAGLAIDLGRGYIEQIRLARAVDGSVLAAARSLRQGQATALLAGRAVAGANGVVDGTNGIALSFSFGTNAAGENTVSAAATRPVPTSFMRVFGHTLMNVGAVATAAVPPVDMVLVLDQSGSLGSMNAWDDLQDAATSFVGYFDDGIDQVGLVSYQVRAAHRVQIQSGFTNPITQAIRNMRSAGDTNTGEGLRFASTQMASSVVRPRAVKVVVFFTDGRPTAFRGNLGGRDRVLAVGTTGTRIRGYFNNPDQIPLDQLATPDGCRGVVTCFGYNENGVRNQARTEGLLAADQLRQDGVLIYTIGLGNPAASDPLLQPDLNYLRDLANENGRVNPNQLDGRMFFAPSAAQLQAVFDQVAQDLLVRLSS